VYEASQLPLGKRVALKVLHASQLHSAEVVQRFQAEAEATARLRHPHIVDVIDLGEHEGRPFIAMEFLEGETLSEHLDRATRRLPAQTIIDLLIPVFSAVATVHDAGIVHRDLKPANIFLATVRPGRVQTKLLDFGIAKMNDARGGLTRTGSMMGTLFYMSPEQARESKDVDARSDQWALAVILYECLTGRLPFPGEATIDILTGIIGTPVPPMTDAHDLPPGLEGVLHRALRKDRDQRFASVRAMASRLLTFASARVVEEWSSEFGEHAETLRDRTRVLNPVLSPLEAPPTVVSPSMQSVSFAASEIAARPPNHESDAPFGEQPQRWRSAALILATLVTAALAAVAGTLVAGDRPATVRQPSTTPARSPVVLVTRLDVPASSPIESVVPSVPPPEVDSGPAREPVVSTTSAVVPSARHPIVRPIRRVAPAASLRDSQGGMTSTGIPIH
jgi:serine/threonine-protein kinase